MPDTDIEFQNEKEWRRYQIKRLDALESKIDGKISTLEKRMTSQEILGATLNVKTGFISAFIGAISGSVTSLLKH